MFDWTFVTHYAPFFVSGAEMTLFISVFGIVLSIIIALALLAFILSLKTEMGFSGNGRVSV